MTYLGSYDSFSVLLLRKVRENSWNLSTFSLLLKKPNYKNPRRFLYLVKHTKFVLIPKWSTVLLGKTMIKATFNLLDVIENFSDRTRCSERPDCTWVVAVKMPLYNVHNLQHRAQVMTTFLNEIPLKIRQGCCVTL